MRTAPAIAFLVLACAACRGGDEGKSSAPAFVATATAPAMTATPTPDDALSRLPKDRAGQLVARAIEASGGWAQWRSYRYVSFVSTLTLFDRIGNTMSETILLQKSPLHEGMRTRVESIGLSEEVVLGVDRATTWMFHDGKAVSDPLRTAFTRFNAVTSHYWFTLPFAIADNPDQVRLSYAGDESDGGREWDKVRIDFLDPQTRPADWLVLYLDRADGLPGRVLGHVTAEFLRHPVWLAKLREYREWGGIKKERRRTFFPADEDGHVIGPMAAEQLIEHVRFGEQFDDSLFVKPLAAGGGSPT